MNSLKKSGKPDSLLLKRLINSREIELPGIESIADELYSIKGSYDYRLRIKTIPTKPIKLADDEINFKHGKRLYYWLLNNLPAGIYEAFVKLIIEHQKKIR